MSLSETAQNTLKQSSQTKAIQAVRQESDVRDDGDSLMGRAFGCELGRLPKVAFRRMPDVGQIAQRSG